MDTRIISAEEAARQGKQWSELRSCGGWLCWLEFDPALAASVLRMRHDGLIAGQTRTLTPDHFSLRSRVHEYGGGSFCLLPAPSGADCDVRVVFVNEADQKVYVQALMPCAQGGRVPVPLTSVGSGYRFGDLVADPIHQRVLAVREHHPHPGCAASEVGNELVAITIGDDVVSHCLPAQVLATGADFYASPRISPSGRFVCWLSWNHPKQPWLSTTLTLAHVNEAGDITDDVVLVNPAAADISVFQPEFDQNDQLLFVCDRDVSDDQENPSDWWSLYRYQFPVDAFQSGRIESLLNLPEHEFGVAQWQLGLSTWAVMEGNHIVASYFRNGHAGLGILTGKQWHDVGEQQARFHALTAHECDGKPALALLMESQHQPTRLIRVPLERLQACTDHSASQLDSWTLTSLGEHAFDAGLDMVAFSCGVLSGQQGEHEQVHGFYYPPFSRANDVAHRAACGVLPPLLIQLHGGPTAMADASFDPLKHFWQQRGFAVLVVNYRGSSGFGRCYRHCLKGQWGISDVEDVQAVMRYAVEQGWADPDRIFIRGNSAGGYTVLRALGQSDMPLRGGASHYGISDLLQLDASTHKFESHYLRWLIGDVEQQRQRYLDLSPIQHGVCRPVIFFQGQNDRVVPPDQTLNLHHRLQQQGIPTEHCLFAGEGHGFRQACHRQEVLLRELSFYQRLMR